MTEPIVRVSDLRFAWPGQPVLLDIDQFQLAAGERLFLRGPSGSGKSTFLGLIAGVLESVDGTVEVMGQNLIGLPGSRRDRIRADHLGVIFQMFNLVPYLSVVQNVALTCRFSKRRRAEAIRQGGIEAEAKRLLARLGLEDEGLRSRRVTELSVGQQQRVAAARALIGNPALIIADEPTSALDADARDRFIELLSDEATKTGAALLFVSHDGGLARLFDRAIDLEDLNRADQVEGALS
ncbi:MAG: ABC transporter ATP-binding protein [Pseudomonadota bacterium]